MAEQPQSGLMQSSPHVEIFVAILDVNMLGSFVFALNHRPA